MVDNYFSFKTNYVSFQPNFCISTHHRVRVSHTNGYFLSLEWHYLLFQPMWTSSKPANTADRLAYIADIKPFTLEGGMRIDVTSKPSKMHARLGARNNKSTCFRLSTTFIAQFIIKSNSFNVHFTGKSFIEILKNQCVNFRSNSIYSETRFQFGCSMCRTQCVYLLFFFFLFIFIVNFVCCLIIWPLSKIFCRKYCFLSNISFINSTRDIYKCLWFITKNLQII